MLRHILIERFLVHCASIQLFRGKCVEKTCDDLGGFRLLPTAVRLLQEHQPARSKILQQICFLKPEYCNIGSLISSTTSISKWGEHGSNLPVHPRLPLLLQESHQGPHPPVQVLMDVNLRLLESRNLVSSFNFQHEKTWFSQAKIKRK